MHKKKQTGNKRTKVIKKSFKLFKNQEKQHEKQITGNKCRKHESN